MKIQLTKYGVQRLNETSKPLSIKSYVLGTDAGYTLTEDVENIKGTQVYKNTMNDVVVINANVYQYSIFLDATVGTFYFGEIAFLDDNSKCVAVAVAEEQLQKIKISGSGNGNSLRIDAFLSMNGGTYTTWADSVGSDVKFQIPVAQDIDNLPPTADSDPNCYIVSPQSQNSGAVICYTAGSTGLWNFDCYVFNTRTTFQVLSATSTSVNIDVSNFTKEQKQEFIPQYLGHKLIEFSSGECFSICRVVKSVVVIGTKMTVSFRTPLAVIPSTGDSLILFSRTQLSTQEVSVPIAGENRIGGVKVGDDFKTEVDGTLSLNFNPARAINGLKPDDQGNVALEGLLVGQPLTASDDLDDIKETSIRAVTEGVTVASSPIKNGEGYIVNTVVIQKPEGSNKGIFMQQVQGSDTAYFRYCNNGQWYPWNRFLTDNQVISMGTF